MKVSHVTLFSITISFLASLATVSMGQTKNAPAKVDVSHLSAAADLEITVWATSPDFFNPTNMDMDAHGRMWVTEGVNYRGKKNRRAEGDRVMVLQDTDGDGKVDKSHVFVQEKWLLSPLGITVIDNKILVAQPPELIVYTDVDRNLVFDPKIDKREVLLTGFNGRNHDHSLHAVIPGPDGKWYINQGNCGAKFTDKSGKTFSITSSYVGGYNTKDWPANPTENAGKKSDDGYVWVGGFVGRMNPDGTEMEIVGHNMRNSYEHTVNSMGEMFQSDNDDPPACRNSFILEYGSAGFSSADGRYSWEAERRPGQSIPTAHWRQESPGYMPPGDVYGSGSPTGVAFYENGALGDKYQGMYLAADAGRREIMQYFPKVDGANYKMERGVFLKTGDAKEGFMFRPADVEVGADGAIYVCDWYDSGVGGHATKDDSLSGTIYRIAPKGFKPPKLKVNTTTLVGQIALLKSPSDNVRFMGFEALKQQGASALPAVENLLADTNPWIAVRGIWLLPYLGDDGIKKCEELLKNEKEEFRLVAYKTLRRTKSDILPYATLLVNDGSPRVRREVLSSLRTVPYAAKKDLLMNLYKSWDGVDRTYMEAIGLCVTNQELEFWRDLKAVEAKGSKWSDKFALITWRLTSPEALPSLKQRASDKSLTPEQRRLAIDTIAYVKGKEAPATMLEVYLSNSPEKQYAQMWLGMNVDGKRWDGLIDRDLLAEKAGIVKPSAPIAITQMAAPAKRTIPEMNHILKLKGDSTKGKTVANRCLTCHEIGDAGVNYGPGLTGWGANRSKEEIIKAVLNPNTEIAHGFEGSRVIMKKGDKVIEGLVRSGRERAWHFVNNKDADAYLVITTMGGQTQKVSWKYIKKVEPMKRTLMLYPEQLGLTNPQDIADLAEYLRQLK